MQFDAAEVVAAIREIVSENPYVRYEKECVDGEATCSYVVGKCTNGTTGCLVGQGILKVYPDALEFLTKNDVVVMGSWFTNNEGWIWSDWLYRLQSKQDDGKEWSKCVAYADSRIGSLLEED